MTTAQIKTTAELAKDSESRDSGNIAAIKPTDKTVEKPAPAASANQLEDNTVPSVEPSPATDIEVSKQTNASEPAPLPIQVTSEQLAEMASTLKKLTFKNTTRLYEFRGDLNRAKKSLAEDKPELSKTVADLLTQVASLLEKNKPYQEQLQDTTNTLIDELKTSLDEGQSHDALPAWDRIQGNISNTSGKIRAELHEKANLYKAKIIELRDWKIFAATEKKKQLISQMQHLVESKMHASDRSKHIASMHKEWKLLGRSNQNEELWKEFKVLSDKAYEPCKEYFKQRKQLMADNFKQRRSICEQLEKDVHELGTENVNISTVNKLISSVEDNWKKYAPIEQSKIKNLQKRYYGLLNQLRKLRRTEMRDNSKAKQQCIEEATALAKLEDNKKAMNDAKALQQRWKTIGPTSYKEDKKYWDAFRAACDKIFEQRNQEALQFQQELKAIEASLNETLQELNKLLELEEEAFRACRSNYQTLMQKFSNDLDPRLKQQRKKLTDQFNGIKRKIDMRFKSLPDKKLLQLKEKLSAKLDFLEKLETNLQAITDAGKFTAYINDMENSQWDELDNVDGGPLDTLLKQRWQRLADLKSPKELSTLFDKETDKLRKLCIELEIRANIDTPETDQSTRMEIQLAQLKSGFGKSKPDRQANKKYAKEMEIQSLCFGPLDKNASPELLKRLNAAIQKLS